MKKVLENIKNEKEISGKELAKILGCSESFVTHVKREQRELSYKHVSNLIDSISDAEKKKNILKTWVNSTNNYNLVKLKLNEDDVKEIKNMIYEKISNKF